MPSQAHKSRIPEFKTIEEEAEFWDTHDSTEFEDEFTEVEDVQFVMKTYKKPLTLRLEEQSLAERLVAPMPPRSGARRSRRLTGQLPSRW